MKREHSIAAGEVRNPEQIKINGVHSTAQIITFYEFTITGEEKSINRRKEEAWVAGPGLGTGTGTGEAGGAGTCGGCRAGGGGRRGSAWSWRWGGSGGARRRRRP